MGHWVDALNTDCHGLLSCGEMMAFQIHITRDSHKACIIALTFCTAVLEPYACARMFNGVSELLQFTVASRAPCCISGDPV